MTKAAKGQYVALSHLLGYVENDFCGLQDSNLNLDKGSVVRTKLVSERGRWRIFDRRCSLSMCLQGRQVPFTLRRCVWGLKVSSKLAGCTTPPARQSEVNASLRQNENGTF